MSIIWNTNSVFFFESDRPSSRKDGSSTWSYLVTLSKAKRLTLGNSELSFLKYVPRRVMEGASLPVALGYVALPVWRLYSKRGTWTLMMLGKHRGWNIGNDDSMESPRLEHRYWWLCGGLQCLNTITGDSVEISMLKQRCWLKGLRCWSTGADDSKRTLRLKLMTLRNIEVEANPLRTRKENLGWEIIKDNNSSCLSEHSWWARWGWLLELLKSFVFGIIFLHLYSTTAKTWGDNSQGLLFVCPSNLISMDKHFSSWKLDFKKPWIWMKIHWWVTSK